MEDHLIYHMCRREEWAAAELSGTYHGSSQDYADGFIHLSTAAQIIASAAKHRVGQQDLLLIAIDPNLLGSELKWEPSRGGDLFPHLYGSINPALIRWSCALPLDADGLHIFPSTLKNVEGVS